MSRSKNNRKNQQRQKNFLQSAAEAYFSAYNSSGNDKPKTVVNNRFDHNQKRRSGKLGMYEDMFKYQNEKTITAADGLALKKLIEQKSI